MGKSRQARSGRATSDGKRSGGTRPSSKHRVSAAAIFKQSPKSVMKAMQVSPPKNRQARANKSAREVRLSSSPMKAGRHEPRKHDELHPLAAAFNDTTRTYRNTHYENATKKLDSVYSQLLSQLHDFNLTTTSSPPRASDPQGSPPKITLADKADRAARKLFDPIGAYEFTRLVRDSNGEKHQIDITLDEGLKAFSAKRTKLMGEIRDLEKKWEAAVGGIYKVGVHCMGQDAMSALLLTQPSPDAPPSLGEDENPLLADLELKPAKKKVTFEEPTPTPPNFLFGATTLTKDLQSPIQVSKEDVKALEVKVEALGAVQVSELMQISGDEKKWWARKQKQIAIALQDMD